MAEQRKACLLVAAATSSRGRLWRWALTRTSAGGSSGPDARPLTKKAALPLLDDVMSRRWEKARYREALAELRRVLEALDGGTAG
jgi:hypothetical protein